MSNHHRKSTFGDMKKSLWFASKIGPLQGTRNDLDTNLRQYDSKMPFTYGLNSINRRLGINTDLPLPKDKLDMYVKDAKRVQKGKISSVEAFRRSTVDWATRGDAPGTIMNALGMVAASFPEGVVADYRRKTGKW